ncbi:MAG TPA: ComEC/Rec2 family competence protein [bacterium]|nr:ComEC/Rec2 family competence protein [bacterium]HPS28803.1 ComEC/Rec2 family competence protein [bacterium]
MLLFYFFIAISGMAVFQRDLLFDGYGYLNNIPAPDIINSYKSQLNMFTDKLKNREFLSALTTGRRTFSYLFRQNLINTGTMHIVAISAFHVGLMVIMINYLLKIFSLFSLMRPTHLMILSITVKILMSFFYFFITGASIPTLRALIFILFFDLYILTGKKPFTVSLFLYSITAVCVIIPKSTISLSFIMSALCVATIIKTWNILPRSITIKMISASIILNYILIPVSSSLNGSYPLSSPLVNLLVIPIVSISLPFVTAAQFIIPFSSNISRFLLIIADSLISPASFSINFFGDYASTSLIPMIDPPFLIKFLFVLFFFCALFSKKELKPAFIILNLTFLLPFYFNFQQSEDLLKRPAAFYEKAFCIVQKSGEGRIVFDRFRYNPDINDKFVQKLEKASSECGINKLISIHTPEMINPEECDNIRKRIRFSSVAAYGFNEYHFYEEYHAYGSTGPDCDHIP